MAGPAPRLTDDEIADRIRREQSLELRPARIGGHAVFLDTAGEFTIVHRVLDGHVTVLRASAGSFREEIATVLLGVSETVQPIAVDLPGSRLDRAVGFRDEDMTTVVAVHHSEIRPGEPEKDFFAAISSKGTGLGRHLDDWSRAPVPRADARLLDDWPGGMMARSPRPRPWAAERLLSHLVPNLPAGVRVEIGGMGGHGLVLRRRWDRATGTLTLPDGGSAPVDLPRHELWARLAPVFDGGDLSGPVTVSVGTPEADVLEMRYQTRDRGAAALPIMESLAGCVARLDGQILRTPGNWAVFTSRSDAVIQVECTADGALRLETPEPTARQSRGRRVSVAEAARLLEILAREDRSAVADLPGVEIVAWG